MQSHGTNHTAIRLRDIYETKQDIRKHASHLRRHACQHLELIFTEVTRELLDHVTSHASRWQRVQFFLDRQGRRI